MVLSGAEKKRLWRQRQKERAAAMAAEREPWRQRQKEPSALQENVPSKPSYLVNGFGQYYEREGGVTAVEAVLNYAGVSIDGDLSSEVQEFNTEFNSGRGLNAFQRAIHIRECLLAAAGELSVLISDYKLEELEVAIQAQTAKCARIVASGEKLSRTEQLQLNQLQQVRAVLQSHTPRSFRTIETPREHGLRQTAMDRVFEENEARGV